MLLAFCGHVAAWPGNAVVHCPINGTTSASSIKAIEESTVVHNEQALFDQFSDEDGGELFVHKISRCSFRYTPNNPGDHGKFTLLEAGLRIERQGMTATSHTIFHKGHMHRVWKVKDNGALHHSTPLGYIVTLTTDQYYLFPGKNIYLPINEYTESASQLVEWLPESGVSLGNENTEFLFNLIMQVRLVSLNEGTPLLLSGTGVELRTPTPIIAWASTLRLDNQDGTHYQTLGGLYNHIFAPEHPSFKYIVSNKQVQLNSCATPLFPEVVTLPPVSVISFPADGPSPDGMADFSLKFTDCKVWNGGGSSSGRTWVMFPVAGYPVDYGASGFLLPINPGQSGAKGVGIQLLVKSPDGGSYYPVAFGTNPPPTLDDYVLPNSGVGEIEFRARYYRSPVPYPGTGQQPIQPGNITTAVRFIIVYQHN